MEVIYRLFSVVVTLVRFYTAVVDSECVLKQLAKVKHLISKRRN